MLSFSLWFFNLGSLLLGMTLATMLFFIFGSRHGTTDVAEGCLISVICLFGAGLSVLLYATAMMV